MKKLSLFLVVLMVFACTDSKPSFVRNQNVGPALGTSYSIIYLTDKKENYQVEIDSVFRVVNTSLSTYIPDSDISKINRGDSTVVVDEMFREVFLLSKEVYEKTNGYFDPTVGVLVNAWGFGPGTQLEMDSIRVDSLMQYVGFDKVALTAANTIQKENKNIRFDFNAIAKGYAIDRLAVLMNQKGVEHYLLEVGGEVVAKGENILMQRLWGVGIDDPQASEERVLKKTISLSNRAMASSGNYRKFRIDELTGKKYVHTINPKTGFTKNTNTLGVNVLASTCAEADAYATAFMAMELESVLNFLKQHKNLEAYLIYLNEDGETEEFMTEGFKRSVMQ